MRSLSTKRNLLTKGNAKKVFFRALPFFMFAFFVFMNSVCPAFADTAYKSDVSKLAKSVVDIVGYSVLYNWYHYGCVCYRNIDSGFSV